MQCNGSEPVARYSFICLVARSCSRSLSHRVSSSSSLLLLLLLPLLLLLAMDQDGGAMKSSKKPKGLRQNKPATLSFDEDEVGISL